jgi:hypothetical protein
MLDLESAVLTAWYDSRPEIRRLRAIRDTEGLRVLIELEPAQDSGEIHPAWMAKGRQWADELRWHMDSAIRLEHVDGSVADQVQIRGVIVADLAWRDPSFS